MVVIAISGPSATGKSTLATWLAAQYSCKVVELDRYFTLPSGMPTITVADREVANWEVPESIEWEYFIPDLLKARKAPVTIVEGFILFGSPEVAALCDILVVLTFDESEYEIALKRRLTRCSDEPLPANYREDPLASELHFQANYFEQVVWAETLKHPEYRDPVGWKKPRLVLKATDEIETIQKQTLEFVQRSMAKKDCLLL
jgi:adenylate kinase family enzyme